MKRNIFTYQCAAFILFFSSLLPTVARDRWNPSAVFKFCLCFVLLYNKSLNDWSLGEQSLSVNCFKSLTLTPLYYGSKNVTPQKHKRSHPNQKIRLLYISHFEAIKAKFGNSRSFCRDHFNLAVTK